MDSPVSDHNAVEKFHQFGFSIEHIDLDALSKQHKYPEFDEHITFYDEYVDPNTKEQYNHIYIVDGEFYQFTTTTFVHTFFPEFDAPKVIKQMMARKNWKVSKYFGMTADEIQQQWDATALAATTLGTQMHGRIEAFYNHPTLWSISNKSALLSELPKFFTASVLNNVEFNQFLNFHLEGPAIWNWIPFKTEWRVFNKDVRIAGSVDMLYKSPNYTEQNKMLVMLDWKRSKEIKYENRWEKGLPPLSDIPNANYFIYSLQLNTYKRIIESTTPYRIEYMALGVFHSDHDSYQFIPIKTMDVQLEAMWRHRTAFLSTNQLPKK